MGAGIAALAAGAGLQTLLYDPDPEALARAPEGVEPVGELTALAQCALVIEAAPEDLGLKRALFGELAAVVEPDCVLATNTSSLSVTALAAGLPRPGLVVGMHFFNPPAKMRLVEVVAGAESTAGALAVAREVGEAMGKRVIEAAERPASSSTAATARSASRRCDWCRTAWPPPSRSTASAGWPAASAWAVRADGPRRARRRPRGLALVLRAVVRRAAVAAVALAARRVAAGHLGRKSGRGWYEYPPGRPPTPSRRSPAAATAWS